MDILYPTDNEMGFARWEDSLLQEMHHNDPNQFRKNARGIISPARTFHECQVRWKEMHPGKDNFTIEENNLLYSLIRDRSGSWSYIRSKIPARTLSQVRRQASLWGPILGHSPFSTEEDERLFELGMRELKRCDHFRDLSSSESLKRIADLIPGRSPRAVGERLKVVFEDRGGKTLMFLPGF
ncbi:hypothetical protein ACLMJK_007047 [Lecanora helva]